MKHIAVLIHGYQGDKNHMFIIEKVMESWKGMFDQIIKIGLYDGRYDVSSKIIEFRDGKPSLAGTLVENLRGQLRDSIHPEKDTILHFCSYSMGGLVSRALLKSEVMTRGEDWLFPKNSPQVASIVTLATPHRGTDPLRFVANPSQIGFEQVNQMRPDSEFMRWLNTQPNYINTIPHYNAIGSLNSINLKDFDDLIFHNESKMEGIQNISLDTYKWEINHYNIVDWSQRTYEGAYLEQKMFIVFSKIIRDVNLEPPSSVKVKTY